MFDIGFAELLVIGVVALLVIGPERLPKVARTAGAWFGRLNRYVSEVKGDIDRELRIEELRKMQQEMKESVQKYEILADESGRQIKREVDEMDKVMQAMAATDGGLAQSEYARIKEETAQAAAAADKPAEPPAALPEGTADTPPAADAPRPADKPV